MRSAKIEKGKVVNIAEGMPTEIVDDKYVAVEGYVECGDDVGIGWAYDSKAQKFAAPVVEAADNRDYKEKRAAEYPAIGDQLDAIWKELNYRRLNGEQLVQDADDMLGQILAVKNKYPGDEQKPKGGLI